MTPAAPLVGAVTTAAGGVLLVHRHGKDAEPVIAGERARVRCAAGRLSSCWWIALARRLTLSPPRHDAVGAKAALDAAISIAGQSRSSPCSRAARADHALFSLARFIWAMERPESRAMASISRGIAEGVGTSRRLSALQLAARQLRLADARSRRRSNSRPGGSSSVPSAS